VYMRVRWMASSQGGNTLTATISMGFLHTLRAAILAFAYQRLTWG
jgi:hypothetical protein